MRAASLLAHLAGGVLIAYPVFSLLALAGIDPHGRQRAAIVRAWMRALLRILNVSLYVRGHIQSGAVLYCANHVSWLDIPCLRSIVDAAFVTKSEVRRWPLVGGLAARAGTAATVPLGSRTMTVFHCFTGQIGISYICLNIYMFKHIFETVLTVDTFFPALADPTRLRCLLLLAAEGELCVCELTHALDVSQPKISRHLAMLREAGIVSDRREGLWIHYRINPDLPAWAHEILDTANRANGTARPFMQDRKRLRGAPNRPPVRCCD